MIAFCIICGNWSKEFSNYCHYHENNKHFSDYQTQREKPPDLSDSSSGALGIYASTTSLNGCKDKTIMISMMRIEALEAELKQMKTQLQKEQTNQEAKLANGVYIATGNNGTGRICFVNDDKAMVIGGDSDRVFQIGNNRSSVFNLGFYKEYKKLNSSQVTALVLAAVDGK